MNTQSRIALLMNENIDMLSDIAGKSPTHQDIPTTTGIDSSSTQGDGFENEPEGYTERELKLTKRFIELIGGADRAHELLDKVNECEECLDLIDDDENEDTSDMTVIQKIAGMVPMLPDLPTSSKNEMDLSTLYNQNTISGTM